MSTINFVPNDYLEQKESTRANYMYLLLLLAMVGAIGATFFFIKMRQRTVQADLNELTQKMQAAQTQIGQMEELKVKCKTMMKTMVMTSELLEPVPRSVVLACLTNNLPGGVSLKDFKLKEKETVIRNQPQKAAKPDPAKSQYTKAANAQANTAEETIRKSDTTVQITGVAPSDIQVASYIARLSTSMLLNKVELIESKEVTIDGLKFREFELKAGIRSDLTLTKEDIEKIKSRDDQAS